MSEQRPAGRRYVVPIADRRDTKSAPSASKSAAGGGAVETESLDDRTEVVVATKSADDWKQIAEATGAKWIAPVLLDESDNESYPTGEITVRFAERPTDATLKTVERDSKVRLVRRNDYVDTQVVVAPIEPTDDSAAAVYLPDVCEQLERRDDVASAWLSTRSRYTKA